MKLKLALLLISVMPISVFAQNESPYKTSFKVDGPIIGAGVGLSYLGLSLIKNKKELTDAEVADMSKQDVNFFDRAGAGNYDNQADKISYYPFYGSFALPVVALLDKNIRNKTG